ncbi:MAG: hypothetical protein RRY65_03220 [Pseudoflavonifractor sp.]
MVRKKKNRALELLKDLLIVLLVLSAVYLTLRTQLAAGLSAESSGGWLGEIISFFDPDSRRILPANEQEQDRPVELRPLRMAVNIKPGERYGVQYDGAGSDKLFEAMFSLLGEALGSAQAPVQVPQAIWRNALSFQSGVYFDFQGQVPMGALYAWLEAGPAKLLAGENTRRILLAEDGEGTVKLYYESGGVYYASDTAQTPKGHLQSAVAGYSGNGATFAYEHKGETALATLAPYVMLIQNTPNMAERTYGIYNTFNPIAQMEKGRGALLEALRFSPQASSYVAWGQLVVKEGEDTLTVNDSGTASFSGGDSAQPRYPVGGGGDGPSATEIMEVTQRLAEKTLGTWSGDGKIYLIGITQPEPGIWQADYGYRLDGVTVQLGSEGYAARFIVRGDRVSEFTLHFRGYHPTGERATVLPEVQAAAAMGALGANGRELLLTYEDNGTAETVKCGWIAA